MTPLYKLTDDVMCSSINRISSEEAIDVPSISLLKGVVAKSNTTCCLMYNNKQH